MLKNQFLYLFLTSLLLCLSINSGCNQATQKTTVQIVFRSIQTQQADFITFNLLNLEEDSSTASFDSLTHTLSIEVENPLWGKLNFNDQSLPLYLEKGYHLEIRPSQVSPNLFEITGRGAEMNKYLFEVQRLEEQLFDKEPNINTLNTSDFKKEINAFKLTLDTLSQTSLSSIDLQLAEKMKTIKFLQYNLMHHMVRHDLFKEEQTSFDELKPSLALLTKNFDLFDLQFLDYGVALQLILDAKIYHHFFVESYLTKKPMSTDLYKPAEDSIMAMGLEVKLLELLRAKNVYKALQSGLNSSSQALYDNFEDSYKNSVYFPDLEALHSKLLELQVKKNAPEIVGFTPEDKEVSLKELKGRVIYVDVWATWCKPCIAEFLHSKELMKKYEDAEVSFVYLSIDSDKEAWLQFLEKDKHLEGGLQLIEKDEGAIFEAYQIIGVPRYILIDSAGKIADSDAPKPSSGKVEGLIDGLLKNENK